MLYSEGISSTTPVTSQRKVSVRLVVNRKARKTLLIPLYTLKIRFALKANVKVMQWRTCSVEHLQQLVNRCIYIPLQANKTLIVLQK